MSTFPTKEKALGMYKKMYTIRKYEESIYYLFLEGIMPGSIHQSTGEEASAVGMLYDLGKDDWMATTHRPAGHDIAKGVSVKSMMCEMFGKAEGCCKGKGGAMHTGDISVGAMTANAIVGGDLPIAAGAALAFKMQKKPNVVVCFLGDGATNEGSFHESLNMAAAWKLPMVWFIENNCYGVSTEIHRVTNTPDLASRGAAYGVPYTVVDGTNPTDVYEAMLVAMEHARSGKGPYLVEAKVYRYQGHYCGDPAVYRPKEYMEHALENDGIEKLAKRLLALGASQEELDAVKKTADDEMNEAVRFADESEYPDPATVLDDMYVSDNERCVAR